MVLLEQLVDPNRPITYGIVQPGPDIPGGVPYVRVVDIQDGAVISQQLRRTSPDIAQSYRRSSLSAGDLLISIRGHVGRTAIATPNIDGANLTQDTARVAVLPPANVRYIQRYVESASARHWLTQHTKGVAVTGINLTDLRRLPVPLPPPPEQRRIADILDKADAIRRKRKQAIALTDQLLRSTFLEMFGDPVTNPKGWPVRRLGDVSILYSGNSLPPGEEYRGQQNGTLLLKVGDMNLPGNEKAIHVAREWSPSTSGCVIAPAGSIIFPKRGGAISTNKKRYLVREVALDPNLMAVSPSEEISTEFLLGWFDLMDLDTISNGSTVPQLNKKDISPLKVFMPPKNTQQTYSVFCMRMAALNRTLAQSLAESERLFESLVDRAFRGELSRTEHVAGQLSMF
jgi:type I restriction enzyme S subunit